MTITVNKNEKVVRFMLKKTLNLQIAMKYLKLLLLFLFPLVALGQTNVSNNLQVNSPKILDNRYGVFQSGVWRPYVSKTEANTIVNPFYRANGLTVAVGTPSDYSEYWWFGGVNDNNLVPKIDTNLFSTRYFVENIFRPDSNIYVTLGRLQDSINRVRDSIPPRYNLTAGTNVSIVGTYPNQTVSFSGSGGSESTVWGNIPGTLSNQTDLQAALDAKVAKNTTITGSQKTKITYDSKGLVTSGTDATTTDITEGTRLYYTDVRVSANVDVAANTASRHNAVTIGTANGLSLANQVISMALSSGSTTGALSNTDWNTFNTKQTALGFTPVPNTLTISTTAPLTGGGALNTNRTLAISDAVANGVTKGVSTYNAADFLSSSGLIGINYASGQNASPISNGFLSSTDYNAFAAKQAALGFTPENVANKSTNPALGTSNTTYSTTGAVKAYVDAAIIAGGGYTDENAQDAVAAMASSEFTYVDATPSFSINTIAQSKITNLTSDLALKAPLASPSLTGTPLAPTATAGTNTTQIATTAFVTNAVSAAGGGTVSQFNFTNANGITGSVSNATTTPTLSLSLGAITPTTIVASSTISGSNLSGTNTGDQTNITGNAGTVTNGVYTTGSYADPAWITSLAWSKITGTPTTLAGYGITDGVSSSIAINTTAPLTGGGNLTTSRTLAINDAIADGATKGAATFTASDFNSSAGNISIDYANGQTAATASKGFVTSTDWNAFNNKQNAITLTTTGSGAATFISNVLNIPTPTATGTVTSVAATVPVGLTISGSPITTSGTLAIGLAGGYSIPTIATQAQWTSAYDDKINSLAFTGTTTKTLTLNQQDGGTVTGTFTDNNSGGTVTSTSVASANGFAGTVATSTTTPAITLSTTVTGLLKGNGTAISAATANTDYQSPIALTTTGSGAASFNGTTLNIPTPTGTGTVNTGAANTLAYYPSSGTTVDDLPAITANRVLLSDASGLPIASSVTNTTLGFLDATSSVQTQLNAKGAGTVTSVSATGNNGISISGSPITSSGTITLGLGAITPTSVNASGTVLGSNLSGTNTGDQTTIIGNAGTATALQTARTIGTLTGDATSSGSTFNGTANNTNAITLATVNSNVGTWNNLTVNAKGLVTAGSNVSYLTGTTGWSTTGNASVTTGFLGTTDANDLVLKTNGATRLTLAANGTITSSFSDASYNRSVTFSNNAISLAVNEISTSQTNKLTANNTYVSMNASGATSDDISDIKLNTTSIAISAPIATHQLLVKQLGNTNTYDSIAVFEGDTLKKTARYLATPSVALGAGAGTGGSYVITGNGHTGEISVTIGLTPAAGDQIAIMTLASASPQGVTLVLYPKNQEAITAPVYTTNFGTNTNGYIVDGGAGLVSGRTYLWNYIIEGY